MKTLKIARWQLTGAPRNVDGVGPSRVSFLDGFQMELSASSALAKKEFSLKLHEGGRMEKKNKIRKIGNDNRDRNDRIVPQENNSNSVC